MPTKIEETATSDDNNSDQLSQESQSAFGSIDKMQSTYKREGKNALLHGYLHIQIVRGRNLRNMDCCRGVGIQKLLPGCIDNVSDPYVTVQAGETRLLKTSIKSNDLNPDWGEDFFFPVCHFAESLFFQVFDKDVGKAKEVIGTHVLSVSDLLKFKTTSSGTKPLRVGYHKVVYLDGKARHGSLEYIIDFVPKDLMPLDVEVPGVYFKTRTNNQVKLYVNADDNGSSPVVEIEKDGETTKHQPGRLWRDIYDSICAAKHFIYITGWSVDHTQSLLRGEEFEEAQREGKYSPYIGELLKAKAEEGVTVNMMVWDDATSNLLTMGVGMMGTHDEETRDFFKDTKVTLQLSSMAGGETNAFYEHQGKAVMFTHHQKLVLLDAPSKKDSSKKELLGYIGGIDLTDGRWDNSDHPLFRTLQHEHKGDVHQNCFNIKAERFGPREPWHDIHCRVHGEGAKDLIQNFEERWRKQAPAQDKGELVNLENLGLSDSSSYDGKDKWSTQVLRSIDARTADFDELMVAKNTPKAFQEISGAVNVRETKESKKQNSFKKKLKKKLLGSREEQTIQFVKEDASSFIFDRVLHQKKGRDVDSSAHQGLVHHIRRARHMVYIESQYFLSSSGLWATSRSTKCDNLVAAELMAKICQKIEAGERFAAYILLPMWPEGIPESGSQQAILCWQYYTMESMYKRIAAAIERKNKSDKVTSSTTNKLQADIKAVDYLNFYCLANRETEEGADVPISPAPNTTERVLAESRRHLVYVHSKMMVVDDEVVTIGSANVNERSLEGTRDSEIVLASWQPHYVASEKSVPHGDVHAYRLHCWATTMGKMEDVFRDPSSLECVRRVNTIAGKNWKKYTQNKVSEMDSHLIPYPVSVSPNGSVTPLTLSGNFPDTYANILGTKSNIVPEYLTT